MSLPIEVRRAAEADLLEAFVWYENEQPGLGERFLQAAEQCMQSAAERPTSYKLVKRGTRVAEVPHFPHRLYFVPKDDLIIVVACLHASRSISHIRRRLSQ
jgi:plasmid stabilization system protein ParE